MTVTVTVRKHCTAGTAFTGNKEIVIPAEYALSFKLLKPVELKK